MNSSWLAEEALKLHSIFQNAFFVMIAAFLALAVVLEFFRLPVGGTPAFMTLVGRCLIAALLMAALPEIMNTVGDMTDSIVREIGDLNNFKLVLSKLADKLQTLSFSWTSVRDVITILISFLSFFGLYITVYFADAAFIYCWTLIYVFSPLVFALYVFPQTSGATSALFRSILEISLWKICWAAMATLLWSTAVSELNNPQTNINWLTSIVLNLMLMISILMTPRLVKALVSSGVGELAAGLQSATLQTVSLTPPIALAKARQGLLMAPRKIGSYARNHTQAFGPKAMTTKKNFATKRSTPSPRPPRDSQSVTTPQKR